MEKQKIIKPKLTREEKAIVAHLIPYLRKAKREPISGEGINLPPFSLEDLIGRTIEKTKDVTNPLPYNREFTGPNPEHLKVIFFSDGSYLLNMNIGWHDGSTIHSFLVEHNNINYSSTLYI